MSRFLAGLAILVVVLIAVGAWVGWITFHKSPDKATIEIKTQQIEQAGEKVVEGGRQLVEQAADSVKKTVQEDRRETTTTTTSSPPPGRPD